MINENRNKVIVACEMTIIVFCFVLLIFIKIERQGFFYKKFYLSIKFKGGDDV